MSLAGCRFPVCHFLGKNYSANSTTDTAPVFFLLFQIVRPKINMAAAFLSLMFPIKFVSWSES